VSQENKEFDILEFASQASKVIENNFKLLFGLFLVAVVGGSAWSFINYQNKKQELASFAELYKITQQYNQIKEGFAEAETALEENDPKAKKTDEPKVSKNQLPSGDLANDYGDIPQQLKVFIEQNKGSNASGEAALILSDLYSKYEKPSQGAAALETVLNHWGTQNVLYFVMQMRAGDLYAGAGNCEKATAFWQEVANSKSFIANQAQLKLGVCLQELGRVEEAKQWFTRLQDEDPNSTEGFSAKRYLRFLKFKSKVENHSSAEDKAQTKKTTSRDQAS
jgi:tetratricopeptide (TPR) repeat protein